MVGLYQQGSRPDGKLVDHSSWQGWAPNASPNSRPWFNWGTSVVPIRYKCDGMEGQHVQTGKNLRVRVVSGNRLFGHRGAVRLAVLQVVHRPCRFEPKKVLAIKPLPVACQLPSFVGSQGIF